MLLKTVEVDIRSDRDISEEDMVRILDQLEWLDAELQTAAETIVKELLDHDLQDQVQVRVY